MPKRWEGALSNVASSIGATIGAFVAKTSELAEAVQAKERAFTKSIKRRVRKTETSGSKFESHKRSNRKARNTKGTRSAGARSSAKR